ncbi:MAG: DUF6385 domain-containing protein [Clostridium sp.]
MDRYDASGRNNMHSRRSSEPIVCYDKEGKFVSKKTVVKLSPNGVAKIVYNSANFTIYTIVVENCSKEPLTGIVGASPDNKIFRFDPLIHEIQPATIEAFVSSIFLKYTAIEIKGNPGAEICVYFQGQL